MILEELLAKQGTKEIPEHLGLAYASAQAFHISQALKALDDVQIGKLVVARALPSETPIFRGTDAERYKTKLPELWWTVNLRKAANYAAKNPHPIIVIGNMGDLDKIETLEYHDDAIYIASQETYKGTKIVRPIMRSAKAGFLSIVLLDRLEAV